MGNPGYLGDRSDQGVALTDSILQRQAETTNPSKRENVLKTRAWMRLEVREVRLVCEVNYYAATEI